MGASLLAIASVQLTPRHREQAKAYIGFSSRHKSRAIHKSLWERACSRRRQHIQHQCCLTHRFREQARSHIGYLSRHKSRANHKSLWERACSR
ncbi:hypothetical protein PspS49_20210 [Pseudomonas sp. S49]|nr:hypothetical protein PspS49_20210 [Pseudomonas sp. S49]